MFRMMLALVVLAGSVLMAQPPRGFFNWWDSPIAKDLNLSDDQTKQIRAVVREFRTKLIDARAAVEKAEAEVEDSFNEDTLSQSKASDAIERLVAARSDLTRSLSQMSLRLRSVLSSEQWTELQKRRPRQAVGDMMMREMQRRRGGERPDKEGRRPGPPPGQQPPPASKQ